MARIIIANVWVHPVDAENGYISSHELVVSGTLEEDIPTHLLPHIGAHNFAEIDDPEPTAVGLGTLKVTELRSLAKTAEIDGFASMNKAELIAALTPSEDDATLI